MSPKYSIIRAEGGVWWKSTSSPALSHPMHHLGGPVSVTRRLSVQLRHALGAQRRREPALVALSMNSDDVLLWQLDEDGWD